MLSGSVIRVLDGDTLLIEIDGQPVQVDLANIRPPLGEARPWDQLAAEGLREMLPEGTSVRLDPISATNTQFSAYVYSSEGMINLEMVSSGLSVTPWPIGDAVVNEWFTLAEDQALVQQAGLYQALPSGGILGNIPLGSAGLGIGVIVSIAWVIRRIGKGCSWDRISHQRQQSNLKRCLVEAMTAQKQLQREYETVEQKVEDCLRQVEWAQQCRDQNLVQQLLANQQRHAQRARQLRHSLDETHATVVEIRSHLDRLKSEPE